MKIPKIDITQFSDEEKELFGKEISTALNALYLGRSARSVNMAIFLGPINEDYSDFYRINVKIVSRPLLTPNYTADIGFMELLHNEPIAEATPEDIAKSVSDYF